MSDWHKELPVLRVRFARQSDKLTQLKHFYCEGLGLQILSEFKAHDGYDGLILGLPDHSYQLEFVQHEEGSDGTSINEENLLVLNYNTKQEKQNDLCLVLQQNPNLLYQFSIRSQQLLYYEFHD
mgnify:CR=1 FL=1